MYYTIPIGKNFREKAGVEMFRQYEKMLQENITEKQLIKKFIKYINSNSKSKGITR